MTPGWAVPEVGEMMARALMNGAYGPACVATVRGVDLGTAAGSAEVGKHLGALRSEPQGGWVLARALTPEQARLFPHVARFTGLFLTGPVTLLGAAHQVEEEIVGLAYVDAAERGFEVFFSEGRHGDTVVFEAGDVFVRRGGDSVRWNAADASALVQRQVRRHLAAHARPPWPPPVPPRPPARWVPPPVPLPVPPPAPPPRPRAPRPDPLRDLGEVADVVRAYALGGYAVRARRWDAVKALTARQGPPDTIGRACELVAAEPALRPDDPHEQAVLDSLCQLDAYAALRAIDAAGAPEAATFHAGFARYWAQRARPALRAVVVDPAVRAAVFPGDDARLAAALRALDEEALAEGAESGGWPGIGDPAVEAFIARAAPP